MAQRSEIAFWEPKKYLPCVYKFFILRIKLGTDIQTCYKVVSGGRAYSTLSFHDNVDTGSL
jgi:hypothetical protein